MRKKILLVFVLVFSVFLFTSCDKTTNGKSAYEIAVENGFVGTEAEWLESLKGDKGDSGNTGSNGENGKSAYEIAVENGFEGTEEAWLESLKGDKGDSGINGQTGKSAYEIAVENGFEGTREEWLESLKGINGSNGTNGLNGKSAYEIAVDNGFTGTETEWLESLKAKNINDFDNDLQLYFTFGENAIVLDDNNDLVSKFFPAFSLKCDSINLIDGLVTYKKIDALDEYLITINNLSNYEFLGFYYKDELISKNSEMIIGKNVEIDARFRQISFNNLTVKSNDETLGTVELTNEMYDSGILVPARIFTADIVTLIAKPFEGVEFLGWFDSEGNIISKSLVHSLRMPDENYEIVGKFKNYETVR